MVTRPVCGPWLLSVLFMLGSAATSWAGQDPTVEPQSVEQASQDEKPGRVIFALTPLPEPDPRALALAGRRINDITISGNGVTREHVIRRELALRVGEPFDVETRTAGEPGDLQRGRDCADGHGRWRRRRRRRPRDTLDSSVPGVQDQRSGQYSGWRGRVLVEPVRPGDGRIRPGAVRRREHLSGRGELALDRRESSLAGAFQRSHTPRRQPPRLRRDERRAHTLGRHLHRTELARAGRVLLLPAGGRP